MKYNKYNKYILLILLFLGSIFFYFNNKNEVIEKYINIRGDSINNQCNNSNDICTNFKKCCLEDRNGNCRDPNLLACQKFKIKCENKCKNKHINSNHNDWVPNGP